MEDYYKVLTGTAKEVEEEINLLNKDRHVFVSGVAATNELTTVVIQVLNKRKPKN